MYGLEKRLRNVVNKAVFRLDIAAIEIQRNLALKADNPISAIKCASDIDQPYFLKKWWPKMTQEDKKQMIIKVWLNSISCAVFGYDWWLPLFKEIGFITNYSAVKPVEEVTLYRAVEPNETYIKGMSWTPNLEMAKFVQSFDKKARIYTTVVQPEFVLAILEDFPRGQHLIEYVVDYRVLGDIHENEE
ncbi:hypothetical protein CN330_24235 [Priestia megaterium]|uniref:hypothetical protein n=1 Tax=Priestia megaterium TaxID=1404 RepID=UPI000BF6F99C|nr:hypothetical protein [Priestia megaterium]PEZ08327.1 hypothetical protein CN330_24235 [Priestia megaterium]